MLKISLDLARELRRYGVTVDETRTKDQTISLARRSQMENQKNYDYFISIHRNAFQPEKAQGVEVFTYLRQTEKARKLASRIQKELVSLGFVDRGVKRANFHVLRATKAPAVLIEIGFIDNSKDNQTFDERINEIIMALAKAILCNV